MAMILKNRTFFGVKTALGHFSEQQHFFYGRFGNLTTIFLKLALKLLRKQSLLGKLCEILSRNLSRVNKNYRVFRNFFSQFTATSPSPTLL